MKKPAISNMYLDAKLEGLAPYVLVFAEDADSWLGRDFDPDANCLVLSYGEASQPVRDALTAASVKLGWGDPNYANVALLGTANDLFALVEGLDPEVVIASDEFSSLMLAQAYGLDTVVNATGYALGRPFAAFADFGDDLARGDLKQRDWAIIKALVEPW